MQCHNHTMILNIGTPSVKLCGKFHKREENAAKKKKSEMSVCGLQVSLPFVVQIDLKTSGRQSGKISKLSTEIVAFK